MRTVSFGRFSLVDPYGAAIGDVVIAPECILLQRGREAGIHDLSYLVVWSGERVDAVTRELNLLESSGATALDSSYTELRTILRAISPASTPVFVRTGQCGRTFARRRLKAALKSADAALGRTA